MSAVNTDIDIDLPFPEKALENLPHVLAIVENKGLRAKHPTGVYFQNIPVDPFSGYSALTKEEASQRGYFKIDFLPNSIYENVRDAEHLRELSNREPDWTLFDEKDFVSELAQISNSFGIVQSIKPRSITDLAVVLALIRPGKRHLIGEPRSVIDEQIWDREQKGDFRKCHAIAYALSIVVQANLLIDALTSPSVTDE